MVHNDDTYNCLVRHLRDDDKSVRAAIMRAIGNMGNKRGIDHLDHAINNDNDPDVVTAAKEGIKKLRA